MYDITDEKSFENIQNWMKSIKEVSRGARGVQGKEGAESYGRQGKGADGALALSFQAVLSPAPKLDFVPVGREGLEGTKLQPNQAWKQLSRPCPLCLQNASAGVERLLLGNKCDMESKRKVPQDRAEKVTGLRGGMWG